ncbi:MAG: Hsp20 family protein [Candidatus Lokiarchaeota archaeon]|nr:Hsp20 family protein [Candidatus Lokiarchaeota archaeon]
MPNKFDEKDEDEDEDDEIKSPFDFFKIFSDPNKLFKSKKFQAMFKDIFEKVLKNLPPNYDKLSPEELARELMKNKDKFGFKGPFMYGFNVSIGPDGMPKVGSFGNLKPKSHAGETKVEEKREPLVEVVEDEDEIIIIAEMPGVIKDQIELKATSRSLTISADSEGFGRSYYKEVELPAQVDSSYAKANYRNGILEVKLTKIKEEQKDIKID